MTLFLGPAAAARPVPTELRGSTVLVLHAHPDDEAIFTGITLRRLADAGARVVLVTATAGELGESFVPLGPGETVGQRRIVELERAAAILGVARLVLLGRRDSGLPGWADAGHPRALARVDPGVTAAIVADLASAEGACALVHYDPQGIYGHPDHVMVHRVGTAAARLAGIPGYQATVDREHLHFTDPEAHLVRGAARAAAPSASGGYGRVTAEISLAIAGTADELAGKRAALAAHASQISGAMITRADFDDAYQLEWYLRDGPPGVLDELGNCHALAGASAGTA